MLKKPALNLPETVPKRSWEFSEVNDCTWFWWWNTGCLPLFSEQFCADFEPWEGGDGELLLLLWWSACTRKPLVLTGGGSGGAVPRMATNNTIIKFCLQYPQSKVYPAFNPRGPGVGPAPPNVWSNKFTCIFYKRTFKVCENYSWQCPETCA